jgi:hypothetical protein
MGKTSLGDLFGKTSGDAVSSLYPSTFVGLYSFPPSINEKQGSGGSGSKILNLNMHLFVDGFADGVYL